MNSTSDAHTYQVRIIHAFIHNYLLAYKFISQ